MVLPSITGQKTSSIVLGLGYGDEGKGLITDWLADQLPSEHSMVIRFSGSYQAGHTVKIVSPNLCHAFSHFGSGTFRGVPTLWTDYCPVSPISVIQEYNDLISLGQNPILYIDENCIVITPFDIFQDQNFKGRFTTTGFGIGTTLQREEANYHLTVKDLAYPNVLTAKLKLIADYYNLSDVDATIAKFITTCHKMLSVVTIVNKTIIKNLLYATKHYIFEGSQGILLDRLAGFFPYVTRSYTTSKNAMEFINKYDLPTPTIYYVTRAYVTRHGSGPMPFECNKDQVITKPYIHENNVENHYQGKFRYGYADIEAIKYALSSDKIYHNKGTEIKLMITCVDQCYKNSTEFRHKSPLYYLLTHRVFNETYLSFGPTAKDIIITKT